MHPHRMQHGTVTVKRDGRLYEITTFRTEAVIPMAATPTAWPLYPTSGRTWARRDFTINAMAYSAEEACATPLAGRKIWPGAWVRAVGEPLRRFEEDALRILRLYRFAARFGFVIDEDTERRRSSWPPTSTACRWSASKKSWTSFCLPEARGRYLEAGSAGFVLPELPLDYLSEAREIIDAFRQEQRK